MKKKETTDGGKEKKARKRGQGEGSIYMRTDGRWAAAAITGYKNGKLQRKTFYGKTRAEVAGKLTDALNKQQKGLPLVGEKQTVKQFLDDWLENTVKPTTRTSTYLSYKQKIKLHIVPEIGHIRLAKLTPQHVQRMITSLMQKDRQEIKWKITEKKLKKREGEVAKKLSNRTVQYSLMILRMALKKAETWGLVARNVALLADAPKVERFEVQPIDADEAKKFLEIIKGDRLEALFSVGLSLGLRRGEVLALRWSDIDFDNQTLRVTGSLQRLEGKLLILPPKTKKSNRALDLPKTLLQKLREHRARQLEERLALGADWQDNNLVFCTSIGTPIEPRNIQRKLAALMKDSGMRSFRLHDLRHFFASLLLAQGVELKVVSELLGHSSIQITGDIYAHVLPKLKQQAVDLLDTILTGTK